MKLQGLVVTGLGALSCHGVGVARLPALDASRALSERRGDGDIPGLVLDDYIEPNRSRRMDPTSAWLVVAARLAARHAGLNPMRERPDASLGVAVGTGLGALQTALRYARRLNAAGPASTNPIDFPDSIDGAPAAHIAMELGCEGPSSTHVEFELSAESALIHAAFDVLAGRAERMLVVAGDAPVVEATQELQSLFGADADHPLVPGAAALVLERASAAMTRGAPVLAHLRFVDWAPAASGARTDAPEEGTLRTLATYAAKPGTHWLLEDVTKQRPPRLCAWLERRGWSALPVGAATGRQPSGGLLRLVHSLSALQATVMPGATRQLLHLSEDTLGNCRVLMLELQ